MKVTPITPTQRPGNNKKKAPPQGRPKQPEPMMTLYVGGHKVDEVL